jgi:hypothetical protein
MTDFKTWLEAIEADFPDKPWLQEMLIREAQKTGFGKRLPPGFTFLGEGFVCLGFENLGLPSEDEWKLAVAFVASGVAVPGTPYRLRNVRPLRSVVEPTDWTERATLPAHWKEGVLVMGRDDRYSWIGKRVALEQLGKIDLRDYEDAGDGWTLKDNGGCNAASRLSPDGSEGYFFLGSSSGLTYSIFHGPSP